jgi:Skp family chaperone for outer membrane proteins
MRKSIALAVCFVLLSAVAARAEMKAAVFDVQVVAENSDAMKEAQEKWKATYDGEKQQLEKQRDELTKKAEGLAKATEAQKNEFRKAERDYTEKTNAFMRKMQMSEIEIRKQLDALIVQASTEYANAKGYALILDAKSAPFFDKSMDVTDDMVKEANRVWTNAKAKNTGN